MTEKGRREAAVLREAFQRERISYPSELRRRRRLNGLILLVYLGINLSGSGDLE